MDTADACTNRRLVLILLYSGLAILIAHPRLYWGQTGNSLSPMAGPTLTWSIASASSRPISRLDYPA